VKIGTIVKFLLGHQAGTMGVLRMVGSASAAASILRFYVLYPSAPPVILSIEVRIFILAVALIVVTAFPVRRSHS
jgi:hypothetical protein